MKFEDHQLLPMLIGAQEPAFDDDDYVYELKMDGVRCLLYADDTTFLQNKRGLALLPKFPELKDLHKQTKRKCILDGELYIFKDGVCDFFEVQKRTLTSNTFKIHLHSKESPAVFTAFDILYDTDTFVFDEPLIQRKKRLAHVVKENAFLNLSRVIENEGIALFQLSKEYHMEGIVAKRKDSKYYPGKRTKEWIKCKNLLDDDFIITGYLIKEKGIVSLILAQRHQDQLVYMGHVTLGVSLSYLHSHSQKSERCPFSHLPSGNEDAIWITPFLVGTVKFMEYTKHGGLRQPVFKGFRDDKTAEECIYKE